MRRPQKACRYGRFGPFQFDTLTQELRKDGAHVPLQFQPFRILVLLASNPDELVTRENIRRELWPEETSLGFDNSINASINKLRAALDDSPRVPRYVETLARRGYRFIAPVEWVEVPADDVSASWIEKLRRAGNSWLWQAIVTSLVLGLLAAILTAMVQVAF